MKKAFSFFVMLVCMYPAFAQNGNTAPLNSAEIIQKGIELHDKGEYKEAIKAYKQVHRSDTNYVWALYEMGLSYTADSQLNNALKVYEEALALPTEREREPELYTNYASLIDDMGDHDRALRIFDSTIAKFPAYSPAYLNKATTLYRIDKYIEADAILKKTLLQDPYSYSSHYMLALCQLRQGKIVPAFLGFTAYLMVSPQGRYHRNCINFLSAIANNTEYVQEFTEGRTDESETYKLVQEILLAKIALNKDYKSLTKLDDPIARQIQVVFEKLEFDESSDEFYMQYYVPLFKNIFQQKKYEYFINHIFSNVNLDQIQDFNRKNKKEIQALIEDIVAYLNMIRSTRELQYNKREKAEIHYTFNDRGLVGKGKWKDNGETYIGPWEFFYSGGNIRSRGSYNAQGEREGEWTYYYFPGNIKAKESYKNGKRHGECIYYYSNGNISSKENYIDDQLDGVLYVYHMNGHPSSITNFKKDKREGERKEFSKAGLLTVLLNYKADSLDGVYKSFYPNGQVETIAQYVNGKLHGPVTGYHKNGQLALQGVYADGKHSGTWKRFHENGKLKTVEPYVNGNLEGQYEEYFRNGQLNTKLSYKKNKLNGEVNYYGDDGKLYLTQTYDDNVLKAAKYFDKEGKTISESRMKNRNIEVASYTPMGTKYKQVTYNEKGETAGTETFYYPSGNPSQVNEYKDGVLNGMSTNYHHNGKKKSEINFTEGSKNGYFIAWFPHGKVQQEGWYVDDMAEDYWTFYNEHGARTTYAFYYNDDVTGIKQEFWPTGKVEFETWYAGGVIEKFVQFDTTGKVLQTLHFPKGSGKFTLLSVAGKLYAEGNYVNGELHGEYKVFFPDGSLQSVQYYKNGLNDSIYRSYSYGGKPATEGQYRMGDKVGTWKYYRMSGKLQTVETFDAGVLHGVRTHYFENGKPDLEINFEYDEREGLTKKYTPDGNLMYQIRYDDGLPVGYSYPDKTGKPVAEIPIKNGTGQVKTYYPDGTLSAEFAYADGKLHGPDNEYHPNGKPKMISTEDYGSTEGSFKSYHPSGHLKSEFTYAYDNLHGYCKEYNEKGVLIEEGNYYNGYAHGPVKMYDDTGKLKAIYVYYYGQLLSVKK